MAHGLPDWYRGVDIAYQALAEMITRPKYGAAALASSNTAVTASAETTLVSVSGKGMLYGGVVFLNPAAAQPNSKVRIYADGSILTDIKLADLDIYSIDKANAAVAYKLKYDASNKIYSVGLSYGYTFETSLVIKYLEAHSNTPTVYSEMVYALI